MTCSQAQLLAFAVYEIRLLLGAHLGSDSTSDLSVRTAAHLAYALHNEADSILHGGSFDVQRAVERLGAVDNLFASNLESRLMEATRHEP